MLHKSIPLADRHAAHNYEYANAAARTGATGFVAGDLGKLAWQTDDDTFWVLKATTPTWASFGGGATSLDGLSDVVITSAATNNMLRHNGTNFVNTKNIVENKTALGANDVDLSLGNLFAKTISGATTLTVSNVPATGTAVSFILELTNGGSATITWWSGMKWEGGTAPTLTAAGVDILGFYTHDGGTTWRGLVMAKDSR